MSVSCSCTVNNPEQRPFLVPYGLTELSQMVPQVLLREPLAMAARVGALTVPALTCVAPWRDPEIAGSLRLCVTSGARSS